MSVLQQSGGRGACDARPPDTRKRRFLMHPHSTLPQRFWSKVDTSGECWLWRGAKDGQGYAEFFFDCRQLAAHRLIYEALVGPIPAGLTIDHLCRNRACVNPAHLEPVSNRVNILRGEGITAQQARQTHCKNGHAFDLFNTRWETKGSRKCRICEREYERNRPPRKRRRRSKAK